MTTPDEARAMFEAMLNQIPDTMLVSQLVLTNLATLSSVREPQSAGGEISLEKLHAMLGAQKAVFANCLIILENRLERLEGRPGIPDDRLEAIMTEFLGVRDTDG
jgi:hypothetical protein